MLFQIVDNEFYYYYYSNFLSFELFAKMSYISGFHFGQIRTEEMDLIAQRGIASHYSGRGFVTGLVGRAIPSGRSSRGKTVCLNNANIALRVCIYIHW